MAMICGSGSGISGNFTQMVGSAGVHIGGVDHHSLGYGLGRAARRTWDMMSDRISALANSIDDVFSRIISFPPGATAEYCEAKDRPCETTTPRSTISTGIALRPRFIDRSLVVQRIEEVTLRLQEFATHVEGDNKHQLLNNQAVMDHADKLLEVLTAVRRAMEDMIDLHYSDLSSLNFSCGSKEQILQTLDAIDADLQERQHHSVYSPTRNGDTLNFSLGLGANPTLHKNGIRLGSDPTSVCNMASQVHNVILEIIDSELSAFLWKLGMAGNALRDISYDAFIQQFTTSDIATKLKKKFDEKIPEVQAIVAKRVKTLIDRLQKEKTDRTPSVSAMEIAHKVRRIYEHHEKILQKVGGKQYTLTALPCTDQMLPCWKVTKKPTRTEQVIQMVGLGTEEVVFSFSDAPAYSSI